MCYKNLLMRMHITAHYYPYMENWMETGLYLWNYYKQGSMEEIA